VSGPLALALATGVASASRAESAPAASPPVARVELDDSARERLDLATAPVEAGALSGEVSAYGRVLDPLPLVDAAMARATARSDAALALRERDRVRELARDHQNASARDVEAAEAALVRANLALASAEARMRTSWGSALAGSPTLDADLRALGDGTAAVARVDLPAGAGASDPPATVHVFASDPASRELAVRLIGPAPVTDPLLLGRGWLLWIERAPPLPGTPLSAALVFPSLARSGWWVPDGALVRLAGHAYVWVEVRHGVFERREVEVQQAKESRRLVAGALAAGDSVVVRGALELLAEQEATPTKD
jgi:hypothetical protein